MVEGGLGQCVYSEIFTGETNGSHISQEVEKRLPSVRCTICKTNTFGVDRRTLQADGECRGVCLKCRYNSPRLYRYGFF